MFVADSCIGGLSVVKSLWESGRACDVVFLADYAANPLGVKSDDEIATVVDRWQNLAAAISDSLVIACNTLSIRYHQLLDSATDDSPALNVVSMVDCFSAMVESDASYFEGRKVLVVGTEFTARQGLYAEILSRAAPGVRVDTVAATALERRIARFEHCNPQDAGFLSVELRQAIETTDIAVLACTCFPMVKADLQELFPNVAFLDPGAWCPALVKEDAPGRERTLSLQVTGDAVPRERVIEYARSWLDVSSVGSMVSQGVRTCCI